MQNTEKLVGGFSGSPSASQSQRIHSLTKQAHDALFLLSDEDLGLNMESRAALAAASQAVAAFILKIKKQSLGIIEIHTPQEVEVEG
jgi:hypothetical protein